MKQSGRVWLEGEVIRYRWPTRVGWMQRVRPRFDEWSLSLDRVCVVGEHTNESGPFADDYFMSFAHADETWVDVSRYAEGFDAFASGLADRLQAGLLTGLAGSTTFASRILWPETHLDRPMFTYTTRKPASWWGRVFDLGSNVQTLSPDCLDAIATSRGDHDA
ncbi:MAG: hypothetical protein AAGB29_10665 [Planctomycetota bacterium]